MRWVCLLVIPGPGLSAANRVGLNCSGNISHPRDPDAGIEPRSPTLWADSLLSEPPEKLKNTGVGSLSLLLGNFPTQESNWDLLHCRWIFLPDELPGNPQTMYNYHLSLKLTDHFDHADNSWVFIKRRAMKLLYLGIHANRLYAFCL